MRATLFITNTRDGLARATQTGSDAWEVEHLMADYDIRCLTSDPHHPGRVYAGIQGGGVIVSADYGQQWRSAGFNGQIVKSLAVSPHQPDMIYAGTKPPLLFLSRDGGQTWTELDGFRAIPSRDDWWSPAEPPGTAYIKGLAISPADPAVVVAGIEFGAVVRSEDGGQTWTDHRADAVPDCHTLMFHPTDGNWAYEGGGQGMAVSQDGGATWTRPTTGLDRNYCWAVAADPVNSRQWFVSASPGPQQAHADGQAEAYIYRWRDDGPWERLAGGLPQPLDNMPYTLFCDPQAPGDFYAGLRNGDVWFSSDYGDTWQQLPFNLGAIDHTLLVF